LKDENLYYFKTKEDPQPIACIALSGARVFTKLPLGMEKSNCFGVNSVGNSILSSQAKLNTIQMILTRSAIFDTNFD